MVSLFSIRDVIDLVNRVKEVGDTVESNRKKCSRLASRVQGLHDPLQGLHVSADNELLLMNLKKLLEEIFTFMSQFKKRNYGALSFMYKDDNNQFLEFSTLLDNLSQDLHLGITIDLQRQIVENQEDLRADNEELKEIGYRTLEELDALKQNQAAANPKLDEILRVVNDHKVKDATLVECDKCMDSKFEKLRTIDVELLDYSVDDKASRLSTDHNFGSTHKGYFRGYRVGVVVKTIKTLTVTDDVMDLAKLALHREALVLQSYSNFPGVVQYFGADDAHNPTLIVTELPLYSLEQKLYTKPYNDVALTFVQKLSMLSECASTFAFLSRCGVIHRDIRPANVLFIVGGHVKIGNFGYAKAKVGGSTAGTTMYGAHQYNAPEILTHTTGKYPYSEATDVYSFCIMMNEVFSGKRPFREGQSQLIGMMFRNPDGTRPPLFDAEEGHTNESEELHSLIQGGWQTRPEQRRKFKEISSCVDRLLGLVSAAPDRQVPRLEREQSVPFRIDDPDDGCMLS